MSYKITSSLVFLTNHDYNSPSGRIKFYDVHKRIKSGQVSFYKIRKLSKFLFILEGLSILIQIMRLNFQDCTIYTNIPLNYFTIRYLKRKNNTLVFDFCDAIFSQEIYKNPQKIILRIERFLYYWSGINSIYNTFRDFDKIITNTKFNLNYVKRFNKKCYYLPDPIDTHYYSSAKKFNHSNKIRIGWIGSFYNPYYFEKIFSTLQRIKNENSQVEIVVVGNPPIENIPPWIKVSFWNPQTHLRYLQSFNIGILPIEENELTRGKFIYKLLQYSSVSIPFICDDVSEAKKFIKNNNGFLCRTSQDWYNHLSLLINDSELRQEMGKGSREMALKYDYSFYIPQLLKIIL